MLPVTAPVRVVEVMAWRPPAPGSNIRDRDWRDAERCLQHALDNHPIDGIWGGTSERERRRLVAAVPADDAQPVRRLAA